MPKYLVTLPSMPVEQVKATWTAVIKASVGSLLYMEKAYVDENKAQAVCCWNSPDLKSVEELFNKAGVNPESIQEVVEFTPEFSNA